MNLHPSSDAGADADATASAAIDALTRLGIAFERVDHPPVFTTDEASRLVPMLPGAKAKNLFLRDAHGRQHFLVVVPYAKRADLSGLAKALGLRKLTFGAPEELQRLLGVTPGSVSVLGLVCDRECAVRLVVDEQLWQASALQCHPLVNTATVSVPMDGLRRLLADTGHEPEVLDVPARAS
jgi:Ala-tRNA(Pro) deacylase